MIGHGLPNDRSGWRGSPPGSPYSSRIPSMRLSQRAATSSGAAIGGHRQKLAAQIDGGDGRDIVGVLKPVYGHVFGHNLLDCMPCAERSIASIALQEHQQTFFIRAFRDCLGKHREALPAPSLSSL